MKKTIQDTFSLPIRSSKSLLKESSLKTVFLLGAILGAIGFICVYGIRVLDVTYDSWLLNGSDITQHYLGWKFFRQTPWHFPLGLTDALTYPARVSIIYTDSIPLFAFIFKVLSPILPSVFQYFGLWGLMCFMLHGGLGAAIIRKYTSSTAVCLLASVFFIISPPVLQRLFNFYLVSSHSALAGHWIILFALFFWVHHDRLNTIKKQLVAWCVLFALCPLVQSYFFPMIAVIMVGHYLQLAIKTKKVRELVIVPLAAVCSFCASMYLAGGFYGGVSAAGGGFGAYNANLNALFHPQGTSDFIPSFPLIDKELVNNHGYYEGYAYLGVGIFSLGLVVAVLLLTQRGWLHNRGVKTSIWTAVKNRIDVIFMITVSILLAINPVAALGSRVIFSIRWPQRIIDLFSIFRTNGRLIWPVYYIIVIWLISTLIKHGTKRAVMVIVSICVLLHVADFRSQILQRFEHFTTLVTYQSPLRSDAWPVLSKDHFQFAYVRTSDWPHLYGRISIYASDHHMVMNTFYLSRDYEKTVAGTIAENRIAVKNHDPRADHIIFLFSGMDAIQAEQYPLHYYKINDIYIGLTQPIENPLQYKDVEVISIPQA